MEFFFSPHTKKKNPVHVQPYVNAEHIVHTCAFVKCATLDATVLVLYEFGSFSLLRFLLSVVHSSTWVAHVCRSRLIFVKWSGEILVFTRWESEDKNLWEEKNSTVETYYTVHIYILYSYREENGKKVLRFWVRFPNPGWIALPHSVCKWHVY